MAEQKQSEIKIAGQWKTYDATLDKDFIATVESYANGEIVSKWPEDYKYKDANAPRPTAYGNLYNEKEGKGYVRFPDYGRVNFTISGDKITWDNDTEWTRQE